MVVGFVNAGIMSLSQAIGIIMGANIGTTVTAQLVSFKLENIAPIALGIGIIIYLAARNQKYKQYAEILLGFGMLFTGMEFMKDAVKDVYKRQVMDRLFRRFGLSGKSFIPLLMGYGCSVPAVMASRTLESDKDRKLTIMITPFMSCGARCV